MPPEVKRFSPEVPVERTGYFWLQMDSQKPFDVAAFDTHALTLMSPDDSPKSFDLKWIVRGERMIFFPTAQQHSVVNYMFSLNGDDGKLQAAGALEVQKNAEGGYDRFIYGHSMKLEPILSQEVSDKYKLEELPQKLNGEGDFFHFVQSNHSSST